MFKLKSAIVFKFLLDKNIFCIDCLSKRCHAFCPWLSCKEGKFIVYSLWTSYLLIISKSCWKNFSFLPSQPQAQGVFFLLLLISQKCSPVLRWHFSTLKHWVRVLGLKEEWELNEALCTMMIWIEFSFKIFVLCFYFYWQIYLFIFSLFSE